MPFQKGQKKEGGRQKGTPNRFTKTVKETVLNVFNELQEDPRHNLMAFAKENPKDFYNIAAKLIPTDMEVKAKLSIKVTPKK